MLASVNVPLGWDAKASGNAATSAPTFPSREKDVARAAHTGVVRHNIEAARSQQQLTARAPNFFIVEFVFLLSSRSMSGRIAVFAHMMVRVPVAVMPSDVMAVVSTNKFRYPYGLQFGGIGFEGKRATSNPR
jgi:hypothetical protein